jgi:hypothetical protein
VAAVAVAAVALLAAGCSQDATAGDGPDRPNCDDLTSAAQAELSAAVDLIWDAREATPPDATLPFDDPLVPTISTVGAEVDGADIVKADGERIVTLVGGTLFVTLLDDSPGIEGSLDLEAQGAGSFLLRDDTALVFGAPAIDPTDEPPYRWETTLTLVSLEDPTSPSIISEARVDGELVTAHQVGDVAHVAIQHTPVAAANALSAQTRRSAVSAVDDLGPDDLLPRVTLDGATTVLGECEDLISGAAPPARADQLTSPLFGTLTVLTVGDDLDDLRPASLMAPISAVLATDNSLFVASPTSDDLEVRTGLHRFALSDDGAAWTPSVTAAGPMLDRRSWSEHEGTLRVVTRVDGEGAAASLSVFDATDELDRIARLDGIALGSETSSALFAEDVVLVGATGGGPVAVIDTTDPTTPELLGRVDVTGLPQLVQSAGDRLLLSVNHTPADGTGDGGVVVSLLDLSDPARLVERDRIVVGPPTPETPRLSPVVGNPRVFGWDPARSQAVIPMELSCFRGSRCSLGNEALVVRVDQGSLVEVGRFRHGDDDLHVAPERSFVIGDDLWSVSSSALGRSDADAPTSVEQIPFP